jgi:RNA polymerase sigma-70 factor (ECF subfamily)
LTVGKQVDARQSVNSFAFRRQSVSRETRLEIGLPVAYLNDERLSPMDSRSYEMQMTAQFEMHHADLSDGWLVSAAQSGDTAAFVELTRRHGDKLLPRVYRITRNWQDAEDVVQESLLKAYVHLGKFEGRSAFSSWLTRIAINSALMTLRKKRGVEISIDGPREDGESSGTWDLPCSDETPESQYARWQREELLQAAMTRLRPGLRKVIHLRQTKDYSTKEIAAELGISVAAAKSRLLRAKLALRSLIL